MFLASALSRVLLALRICCFVLFFMRREIFSNICTTSYRCRVRAELAVIEHEASERFRFYPTPDDVIPRSRCADVDGIGNSIQPSSQSFCSQSFCLHERALLIQVEHDVGRYFNREHRHGEGEDTLDQVISIGVRRAERGLSSFESKERAECRNFPRLHGLTQVTFLAR